jgi:Kdo2-lipid IVA lauroyltransferase/acyltransferase
MKLKSICIWVFHRFLEGVFLVLLGLSRSLPPSLFQSLSAPFLKLLIYVLIPRRRIMRNLQAAFGAAYSQATIKGLAKGVQEHFVKNLSDCFRHMADPEHTRQTITIEGAENLQSAVAKGRGVIALGAHIGNFVLIGTRLGMAGYQFHTLFRIPSERGIRSFIDRHLPRFHMRVIPSRPRRSAVKRILEALKRNEIVFILGDNLKRGEIETRLFGQRVPSPRGPVSLALRSGAAVVPMYLIRNYDGGLHLVIEPEMVMSRNGSLFQDITDNTKQIVRYLENLIRRYPDQWNWLTVRMRKRRAQPLAQRSSPSYSHHRP